MDDENVELGVYDVDDVDFESWVIDGAL